MFGYYLSPKEKKRFSGLKISILWKVVKEKIKGKWKFTRTKEISEIKGSFSKPQLPGKVLTNGNNKYRIISFIKSERLHKIKFIYKLEVA